MSKAKPSESDAPAKAPLTALTKHDASAFGDEIAANRERALAAAETMLREFIEERDDKTLDNIQRFNIRASFSENQLHIVDYLVWDNERLIKELQRCRTINRLQVVAGTPEQRAATRANHDAARKALADRQPAIEEAIAKLQNELATLNGNATKFAGQIHAHEVAVEKLREQAPPHLVEWVRNKRNRIRANYAELPDYRTRIDLIKHVLDLRPFDHAWEVAHPANRAESAILYARQQDGLFVDDNPNVIDPKKWQAHCDALRDELSDLEGKLAIGQAGLEQDLSEATAELDLYCR